MMQLLNLPLLKLVHLLTRYTRIVSMYCTVLDILTLSRMNYDTINPEEILTFQLFVNGDLKYCHRD